MNSQRSIVPHLLWIGTALSAVLGFAALPFAEPALLGPVLGLMGSVVCLQFEILTRLARESESTDRATRVNRALDQVPTLADDFGVMTEAVAASVTRTRSRIYATVALEIATEKVQEARQLLARLGEGKFEQGPNTEQLIRFVEETHISIHGVSLLSAESEFWANASGRAYWDANDKALRRGVKIKRVFVYEAEFSGHGRHVAQIQSARPGVDVRAVAARDLDPDDVRLLLILDGELTQRIALRGDAIDSYHYSSSVADVTEAKRRFDRIWMRASPL